MLDVLAIHQKNDARLRCDFLFRPACAKTCPVRTLYNPDGRRTYVSRFVRSAAYTYKMISLYGSCCAGIHLWPAVACACRSLSRSPLSQSRSDAQNESILHAQQLIGLAVILFVGDCQGGNDHEGVVFKDPRLVSR